VIDVFVDEMDLGVLGFGRALPAATGRPGYHPETLLKIYIYGYLNRVQSSRRLEREAQRNVELIWLTGRLMPDFKTIADFRRDNGPAIRSVCARFVMLCRKMNLFTEAMVALDGSKFKAVKTRDKNFTRHKIKVRLEHLEQSIGQYLNELDRADREPASVLGSRVSHLQDKIAAVKAEMRKIGEIEKHFGKGLDTGRHASRALGIGGFASEGFQNGGNFIPRAPRVRSAGRPGSGRRLRYGENQSRE
jgi:transposase